MRKDVAQLVPKWVLAAELLCATELESTLCYTFTGIQLKLAKEASGKLLIPI